MIENKKLRIIFFFLLLLSASVFVYFIYKPFFQVIFVSAIFATLLHPLYDRTAELFKGRRTLAAASIVFAAIVFLAIPLSFIGSQIFNDATDLYFNVQENSGSFLNGFTHTAEVPIQRIIPDFKLDLRATVSNLAGALLSNLGPFVSGTAFALVQIILTFITLYYFLKNGERFIAQIKRFSPLDDAYDQEILNAIKQTIFSVLRGSMFISAIQGSLVGFGFYLFHVPNAALWGLAAAICSLIPGIGTAFITVPAIIYLFMTGNDVAGFGLLLWAILLVGTIDNFLAPYLYTKGTRLHPLFIFFAVVGGISFFGPMGFLFGPVIVSAFLALLRVYRLFILAETDVPEGGG